MIKNLVNLIFELFQLKRVTHEGFKLAGVQHPDSVAEHSLNAAQIGYIIAKMEKADAQKVVSMLVWHDVAETRIGDFTKIGVRYIHNKKDIENAVLNEQFQNIDFKDEILELINEYKEKITLEGKIAKDADYLEQAFQAKYYMEIGYKEAEDWIKNVGNALRTESSKKLWEEMNQTSFVDWWKENHLKNLSDV